MITLVQKFLQTKTFKDLELSHGVFASFSKDGTKFSLNYDQILAKDSDALAQQCRGLILRFADKRSVNEDALAHDGRLDVSNICPGDTEILAYPMNRFFNAGQGCAANINWNDPELCTFEKLDGSLIILYWDDIKNEWHVATRSVPEADVPLEFNKFTFRTLFEKALFDTTGLSFDNYTKNLNKEITYCFELTSPYNRIIVNYTDCRVHLIAARNVKTGLEYSNLTELGHPVPEAEKYSLSTIEAVNEFVNSNNPIYHEGIVIRDSNFNRIKVKNPSYVAFNKARDSLGSSTRACLEIVLNEKADDIAPFMPEEISKFIFEIQKNIAYLFIKFENDYKKIINQLTELIKSMPELSKNERKIFALLVKGSGIWDAPCFEIYAGKSKNLRDYIKSKSKNGSWSNGFLDIILKEIGMMP